jgi:hypothetical protein
VSRVTHQGLSLSESVYIISTVRYVHPTKAARCTDPPAFRSWPGFGDPEPSSKPAHLVPRFHDRSAILILCIFPYGMTVTVHTSILVHGIFFFDYQEV